MSARIAVTRAGECVRVVLYKGTSGAPERGALWKRSAFKAGDDDVLIASRAAKRMAEALIGPSFWIGQPNGADSYLFETVNATPRLSFAVQPSGGLAARAGHPPTAKAPRVPPGVLATRPCSRCDTPGRYIGTSRTCGEVWRAYKCDNGHAFDMREAA